MAKCIGHYFGGCGGCFNCGAPLSQVRSIEHMRAQLAEVSAALDLIEQGDEDGGRKALRLINDHTDGYHCSVVIGNSTEWRNIIDPLRYPWDYCFDCHRQADGGRCPRHEEKPEQAAAVEAVLEVMP